ncbi:DUF11 domain-containing protein [Patescibacteria group bacterium]|nr:DUF11 domain-containing protein [Patescibacteria group bacterium]
MTNENHNNQEKDNMNEKKIKVRTEKKSSLSDFVKRPLPSDEELNNFENSVKESGRNEEIEQNLSDIYKDKKGEMVDVSKLKIKAKKGFLYKMFRLIFILAFIFALAYLAYWYLYEANVDSKNIDLRVKGPESVMSGERFTYTVEIFNASDTEVLDMQLDMNYADNFIFIDSSKTTDNANNSWYLGDLAAKERVQFDITAMIIAQSGTPNPSQAILTYMPGNFSSQFQEIVDINTLVESHGFNVDFDYLSTALVGETHEVSMLFAQEDKNYINSFDLKIESPENIEILLPKKESEDESDLQIMSQERNTYRINGFDRKYNTQELKFRYRVKEKINDEEFLKFIFLQNVDNREYEFLIKNIDLQIMKSDLNLNLIINSSKNGEPVNFNENLNYTLNYQNKGEVTIEDLTIMLVVDSDLVDFDNIKDENNGVIGSNTIAWSKEQIPDLAEIKTEEEGNINITLPIKEFQERYIGQDLEITSYAQFSMKENDESDDNQDNRSNEIINKLNSDLDLEERILYFNEENIPVGSGPLPPQVGETSIFRVYWQINNNLHDLEDLLVELKLPEYISYEGVKNIDTGKLNYDSQSRKIVWDIGNLSATQHNVLAEFEISLNPDNNDEDKILILSQGAQVSATDTVTGDILSVESEATTTKLEEDEVANLSSDGRIAP